MRWIAPAEKDNANQVLEKRLWEAADQFRANSGLKAGEYSGPVLGLIFLRFAEARFARASSPEPRDRRAASSTPRRPSCASWSRSSNRSTAESCLNSTRSDYLEKFEALIEAYNNGSRNIEDIFKVLLALTRELTEEQDRHVREHLSEEELTVFDLLTRPGPDLTSEEREEVRKVARIL